MSTHLEPGDGRTAPAASRHAAADRAEVRRVQPAGVPDRAERRGNDRDAAARHRRSTRCATRWPTCRAPSVPPPFGGKYRQIMVYVDPRKLEAHQLSPMDVVRAVNDANLILPAGDVRSGRWITHLHQQPVPRHQDNQPICRSRRVGQASVTVGDVGTPRTRSRFRTTSCAWTVSRRSICRC